MFTPRELHELIDDVLNESITGAVYSLKGYPSLAVKEIILDHLDRSSVDASRLELITFPELSHPGILRYHQIIENEGFIYIVMDRHDKTLKRLLTKYKRKRNFISVSVILFIVKQIAAALAYLHSVSEVDVEELVHCDLRPTNILISADNKHVVLAGLSLCMDALWSESTIMGVAYMAPEILLRNETSHASDMWSLGVIIYELVTLRRPDFLEGEEPAKVFVDGWRPDLSGVTSNFIKGILKRIFVLDPEERLTAKELYEMLTTFDVPVSELEPRQVVLEGKCGSLEDALSNINTRIALLEADAEAKLDRITALETALESRQSKIDSLGQEPRIKFTRIDALEDRDKEYLAIIRVLENRIAQLSTGLATSNSQFNLLLLPRLIRAAHTNDMETVWTLVNEGFNIGQRDEQKMTALMHAAQQGHIGPVKLLVEEENGFRDKNGWTALMHAAHNNHPEVIEILVPHEHGRRNKNSRTALMIAAENGSAETASILIPYERDLVDNEGNTALTIARDAGHKIVMDILEPTDEFGVTALMRAAIGGHTEVARLLIDHESCAQDVFGTTAFMEAASRGHLEIVKMLMNRESTMKDLNGVTALMRAASDGYLEVVRLLLGCEAGMKDSKNKTALMYAALNSHLEIVELLMKYENGMEDNYGMLAIMYAAFTGHLEIVKLLFEKEGHLVDKSNKFFFSELETRGYSEILSLLSSSSTLGVDGHNDP